jgi:sugar/nucleoside kinase (ribokinase family)
MNKIYLIGEIVLDLLYKQNNKILNNEIENKQEYFLPIAGGSALNTTVALKYLGSDPIFFSEIGNDNAAKIVENFLKNKGIDTSYILKLNSIKTTISIALLNEFKEAKYDFYKSYYNKPFLLNNLKNVNLKEDDIFCFASFFSSDRRNKKIVNYILKKKREKKIKIFFDPNIRLHHLNESRTKIIQSLKLIISSDILRLSFEDLINLVYYIFKNLIFFYKRFYKFKLIKKIYGKLFKIYLKIKFMNFNIINNFISSFVFDETFLDYLIIYDFKKIRKYYKEQIIKSFFDLFKNLNEKLVVVTDGENDIFAFFNNNFIKYSIPTIEPISTIGAGDTFNASIISDYFKLKESIFIKNNDIKVELERLINNAVKISQKVCLSEFNYPV